MSGNYKERTSNMWGQHYIGVLGDGILRIPRFPPLDIKSQSTDVAAF